MIKHYYTKLLFCFIVPFSLLGQNKESLYNNVQIKQSKSFEIYSFAYDTTAFESILSANAIKINLPGWDDAVSETLDMGFTFKYNGIDFNSFSVNTNGTINLGDNPVNEETNDLNSGNYINILAPLWDDLKFWNNGSDEGIYYLLSGPEGEQVLTIEFDQIGRYQNGATSGTKVSFQVKIYQIDNHFEFIYGDMSGADDWSNTTAASIGFNSVDIEDLVLASISLDSIQGPGISYLIENDSIHKEEIAALTEGTRFSFIPPLVTEGKDISIVEVLSPRSGLLTESENVIIKIRNAGTDVIDSDLRFNFGIYDFETNNLLDTASQIFSGEAIQSEQIVPFAFENTVNLLKNLNYTLKITAVLTDDVNPDNDMLEVFIGGVQLDDIIYNNGDFITHTAQGANGADVSAVQVDLGFQDFGYNSDALLEYRNADQFVIPEDTNWIVNGFSFFHHQTESDTISTMNYIEFRIWDEIPTETGTPIIDFSGINMLSATFWTGVYRAASNDLFNTDRPIMQSVCKFPYNENLTLTPGSYWIDHSADGELLSGPWQNFMAIKDSLTTGDAVHFGPEGWVAMIDEGTQTKQGIPFWVHGKIEPLVSEKNLTSDKLTIYPNPVQDKFYMTLPGEFHYSICDINGKQLKSGNAQNNTYIDVSVFTPGIYIMQISNGNHVDVQKIIKN